MSNVQEMSKSAGNDGPMHRRWTITQAMMGTCMRECDQILDTARAHSVQESAGRAVYRLGQWKEAGWRQTLDVHYS